MKELNSLLQRLKPAPVAAHSGSQPLFVHQLFERQASTQPERVAVIGKDGQMSYGQLNERANQLAWFLRARGIGPEHLIPVCVDRSSDMAVAILGILKSGAAFVPVDPLYPKDRITAMFDDIDAPLAVTQSHLLDSFELERFCLDTDGEKLSEFPKNDPLVNITGDNLAYVIFTSGSTGRPKGTMITAANLAHYVEALQKEFRLTACDNYLHLASIGFSSSRRYLLLPLAFGAGVIIADEDQRLDPVPLFEVIKEKRVTVFDTCHRPDQPVQHLEGVRLLDN
jgi:aspartate racemase